jgi:hypothetical protein
MLQTNSATLATALCRLLCSYAAYAVCCTCHSSKRRHQTFQCAVQHTVFVTQQLRFAELEMHRRCIWSGSSCRFQRLAVLLIVSYF